MEKDKIIYTALVGLLMLSSCAQEDPLGDGQTVDNSRIYFRSYLPSLTLTRGGIISSDNLTECRVTCINPNDTTLIDPESGEIKPYFSDTRFAKGSDGRYMAPDSAKCSWPTSKDRLHFFAYFPSVEIMKNNIDKDKFNLVNNSNKNNGTIDYRLENFRVAHDIADQVDFIAAYSNGTQQENGTEGITLNFSHQLARIELSAWGANEKYDFEIAGVRIGNAITEGHFSFSSLISPTNQTAIWLNTSQKLTEHIFTTGETTVMLSKNLGSHSSQDNAASIMGLAGPAMVIPMKEKIEAWEGKEDPRIADRPYSTNKLYFSVLLRVIETEEGKVVYPYPNDRDNIPVEYFAIDDNGIIVEKPGQLYKGDDGKYYIDADKRNAYTAPQGSEVRGFCWAALPVGAKWETGKIYAYKLNYSTGIGWHDPSDPKPGEPIIERGSIPLEVNVEEWIEAEDHNPNLDVPKR